jgi:ABC-type sugar transport system substrate-binding protein
VTRGAGGENDAKEDPMKLPTAFAAGVSAAFAATLLAGAGTAASQQAPTPLVVIGVSKGSTATFEKAFRTAEKLATGKAPHGQVWEVARIEVKPSNPHPREVRVTLLTTTGG